MTEQSPAEFDLDAWIEGASRPSEVVRIYAKGHLNEELREVERQIDLVKRTPPAERSISDGGSTLEALEARWVELAEELVASELQLHVQSLTSDEIVKAREDGKRDTALTESQKLVYIVAAGTTSPKVTPAQLVRMIDAAGEAGVAEAFSTIMRLSQQNVAVTPSVPFSPRPSGGRAR